MNTKNEFVLVGSIISKRMGNNVLRLRITTYHNNQINRPSVVIFDNIENYNEALQIGDRVMVRGYLQTNRVHRNGGLVAKSVKILKSKVDALFAGEEYYEDTNQILLSGVINRSVSNYPKVSVIHFESESEDNRKIYPSVSCFGKAKDKVANLMIGDTIKVLGYMQTSIRTGDDGSTNFFENVVAINVQT